MKRSNGILLAITLLLIAAVLGQAGYRLVRDWPKRTPAGVLITKAGVYHSPRGERVAEIVEDERGKLKYKFLLEQETGRTGGGPSLSFAPDCDWFMCFDDEDQLWVYVPDHERRYCSVMYLSKEVHGVRRPGELGGWDGVPQIFLERLPVQAQEIYNTYLQRRGTTTEKDKGVGNDINVNTL